MSMFLSRFRGLLNESNRSQIAICKDLNVSPQKLSKWKTGYSEPNFDDIVMLADFFECSIDYLLGRSDDFGNVTVKEKNSPELTSEEQSLLNDFRSLPRQERAQASEYVHYLADRRGNKNKNA